MVVVTATSGSVTCHCRILPLGMKKHETETSAWPWVKKNTLWGAQVIVCFCFPLPIRFFGSFFDPRSHLGSLKIVVVLDV